MRRKITLYIAGVPVDLNENGLVLFNWTAEDLSNPTVVKNSYSQQITLPGTDHNNRLFGHLFRFDRQQLYSGGDQISGVYFDPARKTDFVIFDQAGQVLESGYMKMEKITLSGEDVNYSITLYGGLGSFFYALAYDEQGNARQLRDLDFGEDLTFTINAQAIQQAWRTLRGESSIRPFSVVNFAPAYNGLPEDFESKKMMIRPGGIGLEDTVTEDDKTYSTKNGLTLLELSKSITEWEAQDLRSYLQRPVLSVRRMIEAICNPANNGGWSVNLDPDFFNDNNPYWTKTWMTLPLLSKLAGTAGGAMETKQFISFTETIGAIYDEFVEISLPISVPSNAKVKVYFNLEAAGIVWPDTPGQDVREGYFSAVESRRAYQYVAFVQLLVNDSQGVTGGSDIIMMQTPLYNAGTLAPVSYTPEEAAALVGYDPVVDAGYRDGQDDFRWQRTGNNTGAIEGLSLTASGEQVARARIRITSYLITNGRSAGGANLSFYTSQEIAGNGDGFLITPQVTIRSAGASLNYIAYTTTGGDSGGVRSDTKITQDLLLATNKTPADYLIGFCKIFGLLFSADKVNKTINILTRNNAYGNTDVIDLSARVDLSKEITVLPFAFDSKWYTLSQAYENGQFAKQYAAEHPNEYGAAKVNTGFDFNAENKKLLEGIAYVGAVEVLERSRYFLNVRKGGVYVPSATIDGGTYKLFDAAGNSKDIDATVPGNAATVQYFNPAYPTYDAHTKVQLHDADNKPFDGDNVLLFHQGEADISAVYPNLRLSDDTSDMIDLNERTPCWTFTGGSGVTRLPLFGRYLWNGIEVENSLDFGTPEELDIPGVSHPDGVSIYPKLWDKFIRDKYDDDTRVMTCRVNLSGLIVDGALVRRFFYFRGAIWVLNKIVNHSFTTHDTTQCELIKVQDIENYSSGQKL